MEFMKMALPTDMVQNFEKHLIQKDYNGFKYVAPVHYKKRILNYAYETVLKNWELVTIKAPDGSESQSVVVTAQIKFYSEQNGKIIPIVKEGIAAKKINVWSKQNKYGQSEAIDDLNNKIKSAYSSAIKIAASQIGVGLELYDSDHEAIEQDVTQGYNNQTNNYQNKTYNNNKQQSNNNNGNQKDLTKYKPTEKQVGYMLGLLEKKQNNAPAELLPLLQIKDKKERIEYATQRFNMAQVSEIIQNLQKIPA